jgi:hypothetical protein
VDHQSFGAVVRLLAVASMFVTVVSNYWRHGDIDLTGKYANMRTIYGRAALIGVVIAAVARINVIASLRGVPAFAPYLNFPGLDLVDDAVGVLVTGVVIGFLSKFWNDSFDLIFECKRFVRGRANAMRSDDQPRNMREPREMRGRGRRGGRGGRPMGDRDRDRDRGDRDRPERPERDRGDRGDREGRRPDLPRDPSGGNP